MRKGIFLLIIIVSELLITHVYSTELILNDSISLQKGQVSSFDPRDAYHANHILMVKQLYEGLTDIDENGTVIPTLASSWETNNGKTWTFYLRPDIYFAPSQCVQSKQSRRVVADDVLFTFERLLEPASKSLGVSYFLNIDGAKAFHEGTTKTITGITVKADDTLRFSLQSPDYGFPNRLSLSYVGISSRKADHCMQKKTYPHPLGTGPFILSEYIPNKSIKLQRNTEYWGYRGNTHLPMTDMITVSLTADDNNALAQFRSGKVDFLDLTLPLERQIADMKFPFTPIIESAPWGQLNYLMFNLETLPDKNLRRAISASIDRSMLQRILGSQGQVTDSIYPPALFPDLAHIPPPPFINQSVKITSNQKPLRLIAFDDVLSRAIVEQVARDLKRIGLTVNIQAVPFPVLVDRLNKKDYDMLQLYWGPLYTDIRHFIVPFLTNSFPPDGNNFNHYSNPTVDQLVRSSESLENANIKNIFSTLQELLLADAPMAPLYFGNQVRISNGKFKMPLHPLGYRIYKLAAPSDQTIEKQP
ncbi:MAG: ABC transporter substrate-binding protein [Magnetococcales bacterium]|nr:ABC transporter substrate-binding protein [Magnetococcales bacterium]